MELISTHFPGFLVHASGQASKNLKDSIRRVGDISAGFRDSWINGREQDALETSQEAFEDLDYIQNEILRQRDACKSMPCWLGSPFQVALTNNTIGLIVKPITQADMQAFETLQQGAGALPPTSIAAPLALEEALNKLKHRSAVALNFSLPAAGVHLLYALTTAGAGQPAALCKIDIAAFLAACRAVAKLV